MSSHDESTGASGPPEGGAVRPATPVHDYTADSIEILSEMSAVRRRPGMYVGSTDSRGQFNTILELIDNTCDEHLAGFASRLDVSLAPTGTWTVSDDGRGLPSPERPELWTKLFTTLHACTHRHDGPYHAHSGLHGLGLSVVNALSASLVVRVDRQGWSWQHRFARGEAVDGPICLGETARQGTTFTFRLDPEIFSGEPPKKEVRRQLRLLAALNPHLTIRMDRRDLTERGGLLARARRRVRTPVRQRTLWTRLDGIDLQVAVVTRARRGTRRIQPRIEVFVNQAPIEEGDPIDVLVERLIPTPSTAVRVTVGMLLPTATFAGRTRQVLRSPEAGMALARVLDAFEAVPERFGDLWDGSGAGLAVLQDWAREHGSDELVAVLRNARPLPGTSDGRARG